jgi:hypothetical protein
VPRGQDIHEVDPVTGECPKCGLRHRLLTPAAVESLRRLGADDEDIAMMQAESDDLANAFGAPGHKGESKVPAKSDAMRAREYRKRRKASRHGVT